MDTETGTGCKISMGRRLGYHRLFGHFRIVMQFMRGQNGRAYSAKRLLRPVTKDLDVLFSKVFSDK